MSTSTVEFLANMRSANTALMLAMGQVPNVSGCSVCGYTSDMVTTTGLTDMWLQGGVKAETQPDGGFKLYISSTNAADDQIIRCTGLDENWDEQSVDVTLNGTTPVELSGDWVRSFHMENVSLAATGDFAGELYLALTGATYTTAGIPDEHALIRNRATAIGQCSFGTHCTIPKGYTAYPSIAIIGAANSTANKATAKIAMYARPKGGIYTSKRYTELQTFGTSPWIHDFKVMDEVPEMTDMKLVCESVSLDNTRANGQFELFLVKN